MAAFTKRVFYFIPRDFVPGEFVPRGFVSGDFVSGNVLSLCEKHKEQAEAGQWPCFACICAANGVLRILRGYFRAFLPVK